MIVWLLKIQQMRSGCVIEEDIFMIITGVNIEDGLGDSVVIEDTTNEVCSVGITSIGRTISKF